MFSVKYYESFPTRNSKKNVAPQHLYTHAYTRFTPATTRDGSLTLCTKINF